MNLTKIELKTKDGKKIKLTADEARELYNQLHELFGAKYIPIAPIVIAKPYVPSPLPYWLGSTTCGIGSGVSGQMLGNSEHLDSSEKIMR